MNEAVRQLLVNLIARHDRGRPTRTLLTSSDIPFQQHDQIVASLEDMSREGLIKYTTTPADRRQNLPGAITLVPEKVDELAKLVGAPRLGAQMDNFICKTNVFMKAEWVEDCRTHLCQYWSRGIAAFMLKEGMFREAEATFRILAAIAEEKHLGKDVRQFSVEAFEDSKFFEQYAKYVAASLRHAFNYKSGNADQVFEQIGMTIFPKPTFVSGRLTLGDSIVDAKPYIGLAAEMTAIVQPINPSFVLSIENLSSFHRFCREISHSGLVLFSGGFPSRATLSFLRRLSQSPQRPPFFHWGDIDTGGIAIFRMIEQSIAGPLIPHCMSIDIATYGTPARRDSRLNKIAQGDSAIAELAKWLASEEGRSVEQEVIPPRLPDIGFAKTFVAASA